MLNIFEHNTPAHDGAIIVRGNRIISATCYLPLSDNMELSKELGTRHRAGVGISEVTDSLTIIVSEETGNVSIAQKGVLTRDVTPEELKEQLVILQDKNVSTKDLNSGKEKARMRKISTRIKRILTSNLGLKNSVGAGCLHDVDFCSQCG